MRILVCPQEFKGSLTNLQASAAIAAGLRRTLPAAAIIEAPMADGGPGTLAVLHSARGGELVSGTYRGALGDPVEASWLLLTAPGGEPPTAVIEAAATVGLVLVPPLRRDPGRASSYGVGQQVAEALERGARRIIVGVGGTATNDGGAGAAQALGYRLLDGRGQVLPPGALALHWLSRIDARAAHPVLAQADIAIAADVTNPLLGPEGATAIYGPQKGVSRPHVARLEAALGRWASILARDLGVDVRHLEGAGAGGGLAAGLAAVCNGSIGAGARVVAEAIDLRSRIEAADLVVTGEGCLDAQTSRGKTVGFVAALAAELGRRCYAVAGSVSALPEGLAGVEESSGGRAPAEAMAAGAALVEAAAERLGRRIAAGR